MYYNKEQPILQNSSSSNLTVVVGTFSTRRPQLSGTYQLLARPPVAAQAKNDWLFVDVVGKVVKRRKAEYFHEAVAACCVRSQVRDLTSEGFLRTAFSRLHYYEFNIKHTFVHRLS